MTGGSTIKQLQAVLTRIGSATSGKKDVLVTRLRHDMQRPRLSTSGGPIKRTRILSIDMGIRNLAYCVVDVTRKDLKISTNVTSKPKFNMNVSAWRRLDVGEENPRIASYTSPIVNEFAEDNEEREDPYTPSALSKTAHSLVARTLLPYKPDIILIERQRWRSASSAAIQQWTVRVNTLEGMLWAILTAFRDETSFSRNPAQETMYDYRIFGVDPKRVGNFWITQEFREEIFNWKKGSRGLEWERQVTIDPAITEEAQIGVRNDIRKVGRGKVEKKAKVEFLRSWLSDAPLSTSNPAHSAIDVSFCPDAESTRAALCSTKDAKGTTKAKSLDSKKIDDVTDCFLQAAAWVAWEGNRLQILNHE